MKRLLEDMILENTVFFSGQIISFQFVGVMYGIYWQTLLSCFKSNLPNKCNLKLQVFDTNNLKTLHLGTNQKKINHTYSIGVYVAI